MTYVCNSFRLGHFRDSWCVRDGEGGMVGERQCRYWWWGGHASAGWREVLGAVCQQAIVVVSGWNTGLRQAESVRCGSICVRREPMYYSWWKITQTLLTSAIQSQHTSSCRGVGGVWRWLGAYNIPLWDQSAFIFMSSNRSEWPQSVILSEGPQSARHIQVYTNTGSHGLPFTLLTGWFMQ